MTPRITTGAAISMLAGILVAKIVHLVTGRPKR